ncbi:hypothetical protein [uncultured Mobiluncus sp.]|uniref:hypothetical protein n=1 Tax=uncultured Mobiluncus sp. TaxID=293425 RepID=UPI00262CC56F|nr:hypothetical protein [uncultured Mobiluncus sp.]
MNETTPRPEQSAAFLAAPLGPRTRRAVKFSLTAISLAVVAVLLVAAGLTAWLVGVAGLRSVGLCAAVGAGLVAVTFATHLFTLNHPDLMMAGMGADFVLKIIVILLALGVARKLPGLDAETIFFTLLAMILVQAIVFPVALTKAQVPLLDPASPPTQPESAGENPTQ